MATDTTIRKLIHKLVVSSIPIAAMRGLDVKKFIPGKTLIQYSGPTWNVEELEAAIFTLLRGQWLCSGENVFAFEKKFAQLIGKKHSIMCNSGSSANLLMLSALKSKNLYGFENVQVITPVVCFPTTVAPIIQCNFKLKFIDVDKDSLNLDLNELEKAINPKTKILIFAHVLGNPPDMKRLMQICKTKKIILLEDACDALGSTWDDKPLGSFGLMSSCSFYPAHHLTTGEGGMVSTNNKNIAQVVRSLTLWGRACHCIGSSNFSLKGSCGHRFDKWLWPRYKGILDHKYVYKEIGYNLKPLDFQGAIGLVQLKKLNTHKIKRQDIYQKFYNVCSPYQHLIKLVKVLPNANVSWFGFPITIITDKFKRYDLVKFLEARKIQTRNYFSGNILFHKPYARFGNPYHFPNACQVMERTLFIGTYPLMSKQMIDYVCNTLDEFFKKYK